MHDTEPAEGAAPAANVPPPSATPESMAALIPKRRVWPVLLVLVVVLGGAGFFAFRSLTAPDPLRILVAVDLEGYWWEGSEPAAQLADELTAQLAKMGFDPVKGGDPKVMKTLESAKSPKEAAAALGAGFIIEARLAPEIVEHPIKGGYFEMRVDAPVTLTFLSRGTSSEGRIRGYSGAVQKERALALLAQSMASQALDAVIAQLIDHPAVREITEGTDVKLLGRIEPARQFAKQRAQKMADAADMYANAARDRAAEDKGRVTILSHAAAEDLLVGVTGAGYFVKTADVTPYFSWKRSQMMMSEALETVEMRPLDRKAVPTTDPASPKAIWRGYHVFTYPSSEEGGGHVALVEDLFGWAKTITAIDAGGTSKRVRVDPEHRFVDPKIAPGGKFVAVYDRPERGAAADLMVLETASGKEVFGFHTENESIGGFLWIDDRRIGFFYVPEASTDDAQTLAVVDVSKQAFSTFGAPVAPGASAPSPFSIERPFRAKKDSHLRMPVASPGGKTIACVETGGEPGIAIIDTATWQKKVFAVPGGASWPMFSPDGGRVAFELYDGRDAEIAVLSLATGEVKQLTNNRGEDRLPRFSADGKQVLFEVRYRDPVFPRSRHLSLIASVAAP